MGDVAMVVHTVRALRERYPNMRVSILTKGLFQPLFDELNVEFVPLDLKGRHKGLSGIRLIAKEIRALGIDCVADLHSVFFSSTLRLFLSLYNIRSARLHKGRLSKWMRMEGGCGEVTAPLKHMVVRYCDALRHLGLDIDNPKPSVRADRPNPLPFAKGEGERWIGIAPFSAHEGKNYPKPQIQEVIRLLSPKYDRVFVHGGGGAELEFARDMEQQFPNVTAVFSTITFAQEIDLIANLDAIISMDSFAMHVASLMATPVVSIWGATHPSLGFSGYGCGTEGYVQQELSCRPCSTFGNKHCRFGDYHCLRDITPEMVVERVEAILI